MAIVLIIHDGDKSTKVKLTARPIIVGRSSKCAVKIDDGMCSGQHCAFVVGKDFRVLVKDLDSTNGTFVNDCKVMDTHLMLDDILKIGDCEISIERSDLSPKEKAALTRDEPTSHIKFMNLPSEKKKSIKPSQVVRANNKKAEEDGKTIVQKSQTAASDSTASISNDPNRKEKIKKRIAKISTPSTTTIESERQIDLEESSGKTKMIQIDTNLKKKKKKKKKESFGSKIKNVFKK